MTAVSTVTVLRFFFLPFLPYIALPCLLLLHELFFSKTQPRLCSCATSADLVFKGPISSQKRHKHLFMDPLLGWKG